MPAYEAVCRNCDWRTAMPNRETAEHAERVHEEWDDHTAFLEHA